jgi:hypothetical protein
MGLAMIDSGVAISMDDCVGTVLPLYDETKVPLTVLPTVFISLIYDGKAMYTLYQWRTSEGKRRV